jgi:hypothetical protein
MRWLVCGAKLPWSLGRRPHPALSQRERESTDGQTPGAALLAWLHRFFIFATTKHHVAAELLAHSDRSNPVFGESRARVLAAGRPLLVAAQRSHAVRDTLTLEQILDMIVAIATIDRDATYLEPILQAALDGLGARRIGNPPCW